MSQYIKKLIEAGEGLYLDFKYELSDAKKIARTISAFANTKGGKLLVGVKDNGKITGISSDEEYYMVESAAHIFCRPAVTFKVEDWNVDDKTVLEVVIKESNKKPHFAPDKDGKWVAWIRINDKTMLANDVMVEVWKNKFKYKKRGLLIKYSKYETILIEYLNLHDNISLAEYSKLCHLTHKESVNILAGLITIGVVEIDYMNNQYYYKLSQDFSDTD